MTTTNKITPLTTVLAAAVFFAAFMTAKHDAALAPIIPFGNDPYDAVGSFGVIASGVLTLLAVGLARWPGARTDARWPLLYLLRTQAAVAAFMIVTFISDAVAMARFSSLWIGKPGSGYLLALLAALAFLLVLLIRLQAGAIVLPVRRVWDPVVAAAGFVIVTLAVYPTGLLHNMVGHLATIVTGALVLFTAARVLTVAIVPLQEEPRALAALMTEASCPSLQRGKSRGG